MKLATKFAALTNRRYIPIEPPTDGEVIITGDAHASYAIWLIPLLQKGYITLAKDEAPEKRQRYFNRLDDILSSTYIDELKVTGKKLEKLRREMPLSTESTALVNNQPQNIPLQQAKQQFKILESLVIQELNDFDTIMNKITLVDPNISCKLIDMGDSTGDRGYCEVFMFKACKRLTDIGIDFSSIFSNHTLETLYAILTNSWDINTQPAFIDKDFANQIRSLNNFRTLLHYKIITQAEKNTMLSDWVKHINLMAYSNEDANLASTSIYSHAPVGVKDIANLAKKYAGLNSEADALLAINDRNSLEFHQSLRSLIDGVSDYFLANFYTRETASIMQALVTSSRNREMPSREPESMAIFYLCAFTMRDQPIRQSECPESFIFYHGHRCASDIYEEGDFRPPNQISLDNEYFKPTDPCIVRYFFNENKYLKTNEFNELCKHSMLENVLYYTLDSGIWSYKGKCNQAVDFYNTIRQTLPHFFFKSIEAELTCCFSIFSSFVLPESPTCNLKRLFYTEYSTISSSTEVPILCEPATKQFNQVFVTHDVDIKGLLQRGNFEIEQNNSVNRLV